MGDCTLVVFLGDCTFMYFIALPAFWVELAAAYAKDRQRSTSLEVLVTDRAGRRVGGPTHKITALQSISMLNQPITHEMLPWFTPHSVRLIVTLHVPPP